VLVECAHPNATTSSLSSVLRTHSVNWPSLLKLAADHGLFPTLASQLLSFDGEAVPSGIYDRLHKQIRAHTVFALRLSGELSRIVENLGNSNIPVLATKGPVLSQRCYGDPGMRQYGDLDLIVFEKEIPRITEKMIAWGYEPRIPLKAIAAAKIPGEYVFRRPDANLLVEFHTERTFRYHPRRLRLENLFARQVRVELDGHAVPALCVEDELVLICIHSAKHFWERLMWVADIAGLVTRPPGVNSDRALASAREVGAERMLRVGLGLASQILAVRLPPELERDVRCDPAVLLLTQQIANRMPDADAGNRGLFERALFRLRMRGGLLRCAAYVARLSLSPTEQDWTPGAEEKRSWLGEALGRPLRLARKYGRATKE